MSGTGSALETEISGRAEQKANSKSPIRVFVVGATGYAGRELLSLLTRHPFARIARLMSSGRERKEPFPIDRSHPTLRGTGVPPCEPLGLGGLVPFEVDLAFLATPHETSHSLVPSLLSRGTKVIDLSGAFRLQDQSAYARWYGFEHHAAEPLREAVYGLPELNAAEIRQARLVSNPGCYATSVILALAPLLKAGWVDLSVGIISDSKSGATGAGRSPSDQLHFPEVNENCRAYGLFSHRHLPEILQALKLEERDLTFAPHLLPVNRGILSTVYIRLAARRTRGQVLALFREFYEGAPMVRVYEDGVPEIQGLAHTNYADLGFALDAATGRLIIVSAIDNLGKGAAGQAIQNMNLMFGFPEETALA